MVRLVLMMVGMLVCAEIRAQSPGPADADGLPRELASSNGRERAQGIKIIVAKRLISALPKLESMARTDPGPGVRRFACWAIAELELKAGIPTLQHVFKTDTVPAVRKAADQALAKLRAPRQTQPPAPPPQPAPRPEPSVECHSDLSCSPGLRCVDNHCVDEPKSPSPSNGSAGIVTTGWALEAGVIGLIGAAGVGGLSIAAAIKKEEMMPAIPIAIGASLVTLIVAPSIKTGSKSARKTEGVSGSLTMRVIGWLSFSVHIGGSLALGALIPLYFVDEAKGEEGQPPETSWIITNGALGMVSLIALSIDALIARRQASKIKQRLNASAGAKTSLEWRPYISPTVDRSGISGATAGLSCRF